MRATNWYVITGAPCSGKTAVINALAGQGFPVVHEVARAYIDAQLQKGKQIDQIKADELAFERHILYKKIEIEAGLDPDAVVFLDRAVPDSIAYFQFCGLEAEEPFENSSVFRYKQIFLFDRITFKTDAVRSENNRTAASLDRLLAAAYCKLGYSPVRVPLLAIAQRVDFVLQYL
jgi:predicted ATPase